MDRTQIKTWLPELATSARQTIFKLTQPTQML